MHSRFGIAACTLVLWLAGCGTAGEEEAIRDENSDPGPENLPSGGVCGLTQAVSLGAPESDGFVEIPANHPSIFYYGRVDCSDPRAPSFAYPAVTLRVRFSGDAIEMRLTDFGSGSAQSTNYYEVVVDGGAATRLLVSPATEVYPLARDLPAGVHTVEITKRTESGGGSGKGVFRGLRIRGEVKLFAPRKRAHRVEFIGDSITCGYGNEVSTYRPDEAPYTTLGSNARRAWGALAARALDADYMAVAYSGRGVYRNYAGQPGLPLPALYSRTLPDDERAAAWEPARTSPEVLVINLGTNDFSPGGVDREAFRAAYVDFLQRLRGYYPQALFVLAAGPMLTDSYPPGELAWTNIRADLTTVVAQRQQAGDANIQTLFFDPQSGPWGQDYHPTIATHEGMAKRLVALVKDATGW